MKTGAEMVPFYLEQPARMVGLLGFFFFLYLTVSLIHKLIEMGLYMIDGVKRVHERETEGCLAQQSGKKNLTSLTFIHLLPALIHFKYSGAVFQTLFICALQSLLVCGRRRLPKL